MKGQKLLNNLEKDWKSKRIHILGIAGTLMGAFAVYLKQKNIEVTGSDQNIYPPMSEVLKAAQIPVYTPFSSENLEKAKPDLIIVGNVIRKVNPEMQAVLQKDCPYQSLPQVLESLTLPEKHSIVVAGTHGKTTTSSLLAWILEECGENPSFFIGGVSQNFSESFRVTSTKFIVLEGDEYDTAFFDKVPKFVHYKPQDVILTSVEYDHADIYPDMKSLIQAFDKLSDLVPATGYFITCSEQETPLRIAHRSKAKIIYYGFSNTAESHAKNIELGPHGSSFRWISKLQSSSLDLKVNLPMAGRHNILNALACLTWIHARGLNVEKAVDALAHYKGVKRRQEVYGEISGITLIDDFAHHPTAVRETVSAIRAKYPRSRIIACFEPRSATSRRKVFQSAYTESFDGADFVYIAKPYDQSMIDVHDQFSTEELIASLIQNRKKAKLLITSSHGIKEFSNELKSGDVVLVMSNGSFDGLLPKLSKALSH